jgi:hypothetical protein
MKNTVFACLRMASSRAYLTAVETVMEVRILRDDFVFLLRYLKYY